MSKGYNKRLEHYFNAMVQAKKMLKLGLINEKDLHKMESKIAEKYCIKRNSIYRLYNLTNEK